MFGGPEKDREFCLGESVLVHSVMTIALAASVVSTGATLVASTLQGSFCFSVLGVVLAPADFIADGFPHFGVLSSSSHCGWFRLPTTALIGCSGATVLYLSFSHAKHLHQSVVRDQFCPVAFDLFCLLVVFAPDCQYQQYLARVITIEHCLQPWTSL